MSGARASKARSSIPEKTASPLSLPHPGYGEQRDCKWQHIFLRSHVLVDKLRQGEFFGLVFSFLVGVSGSFLFNTADQGQSRD